MPFAPASPIKKVGSGWSLGGGEDGDGAGGGGECDEQLCGKFGSE